MAASIEEERGLRINGEKDPQIYVYTCKINTGKVYTITQCTLRHTVIASYKMAKSYTIDLI